MVEQRAANVNVEQRPAWRIAAISIFTLLLLALILYQQTVYYLIGFWNQSSNFEHGYLVLAISIYLIVRNRRKLASLTSCPDYRALPAVFVASLLWLMAGLVDVKVMQAVGLLLLLFASVWVVLGKRVLWQLAFPIFFISFAIPIWFPLTPLLQELTADVVFWIIRLLEVPAFREEHRILVPAGKLSIEETCSGLNYLLAALTLGTLYAYLNYQKLHARIIVVLVAAVAGVLTNILRVFIVVYLGYSTDMQHPYVHDHVMLGWYLFAGMVAILLFADARFHRHHEHVRNTDVPDNDVTADVNTSRMDCTKGISHYLVIVVASALIMSAAPAAVYAIKNVPDAGNATVELRFSAGKEGWTGSMANNDDWLPTYHGAISLKRRYQKANDQVILYVGYYPVQKQGEELIFDQNSIGDPNIWGTHYPRGRLKQPGDQQVLEQLLKKSNGEQRLVWYWYSVAGRDTTNEYEAKLLQALGLLTGDKHAYVAAIATQKKEDIDRAREVLDTFLAAMKQPLQQISNTNE